MPESTASSRVENHNSSSSTKEQRLSNLCNGDTDHSTFKAPEEAKMSKSGTPMLDGGNSGHTRVPILSMKEERY
jgi:hypothetical protein